MYTHEYYAIMNADGKTGKFVRHNQIVLILGNGFDLQCKLPTRYGDFFDDCYDKGNKNETTYHSIDKLIKKYKSADTENIGRIIDDICTKGTELSVWDIYFIALVSSSGEYYKNWNWIDVEKSIDSSLKDQRVWSRVQEKIQESIRCAGKNKFSEDDINNLIPLYSAFMFNRYYKDNNGTTYDPSMFGEDSRMYFYKKLRQELQKFENEFGLYIEKQYKHKKAFYARISQDYINQICDKCRDMIGLNPWDITSVIILSLNYIPLTCENVKYECKIINIHGRYNTPIFGVESSASFLSEREYFNLFSKPIREQSIENASYNNIFPNENYDVIRIMATYGVSFGISDLDDYKKIIFDNRRKINKFYSFFPNQNKDEANMNMRSDTSERLLNLLRQLDLASSYDDIGDNDDKIFNVIRIDLQKSKHRE